MSKISQNHGRALNLEKELPLVCMKQDVLRIARWIGSDAKRFAELMKHFLNGRGRIVKQAAWIIGYCVEQRPAFIAPWLNRLLNKMEEEGVHGAVKRNGVRILQFVEIPGRLKGRITNLCFHYLSDPDEEVAVRTFSITVIARIAADEPDLMKELETIVQQMLPYSAPAFRARANMVLRRGKGKKPFPDQIEENVPAQSVRSIRPSEDPFADWIPPEMKRLHGG